MKRYILNITTLITALILSANFAWGQNALPKSGPLSNGTYELSSDQTQTGTLTIKKDNNVIINLNSKTLNGGGKQIFNIEQGGNLTINGSGTITNGSAGDGGCAMIHGILHVINVNISNCKATNDGGVFYVQSTGSLTIENGEFENNVADRNGGVICSASTQNKLEVKGITKFLNNWAKNSGGAIYARTLKITGKSKTEPVVIQYNKATYWNGAEPEFVRTETTKNGVTTISYPNKNAGQGGGIFISVVNNNNDPFDTMKCVIKNCHILNNYAAVNGGGIYSGINTTIEDSEISFNNAMSSEKRGYPVLENDGRGGGFYFSGYYSSKDGVVVIKEPKDSLKNTHVTNNAAMYYGGGGQLTTRATLNVENSYINENTAVLHGAGGLHLTSDVTLNFTSGEINNNYAYTVGGGIHTSYGCTLNLNGGIISGNTANQRGGGVHVNTGGNLVLNGTNITSNNVYKGKDMAYANVIQNSNGTFTWDPNTLDYNRVSESNYKYENNDDTKYLTDTGYGGGVLIDSGTCTINTGELYGNYAEVAGGGLALVMIRLSDSVSDFERLNVVGLTINAGVIASNSTGGNGAGVYIMRNKILEMLQEKVDAGINIDKITQSSKYKTLTEGKPSTVIYTGSLLTNNATQSGGAIYMEQGNFSVNGNITMNENQAGANGGALYLGGGNVNASSGVATIQNNTAVGNGGAIYVGSGSITLQKATISGNTSGNGGAIYAKGDVTINDEATINTNTATGNGGAIYVEGGNLTTKKVTASGNRAANGGVFFVKGGNVNLGVTVSGQTITQVAAAEMTSNKALDNGGNGGNGGAIALENGVFTMHNDSKISSNSAGGYGGALYIKNEAATSITCKGGTFSQNTAKAGGAVCADGPITLALAANIENNTAQVGGGIYLVNGVNMTFGDASQPLGLIRANKAQGTTTSGTAKGKNAETENFSGVGGGIFMAGTDSNKTTLTFANAKELGIYNNSASFAGADICANGTNTLITLPRTSEMNLTGFDVPGNMLYWAEDFANGDTGYTEGTKLGDGPGIRYVDELRAQSPNVKHFSADSTHDVDKYACLDLGYDLVFVKIKNTGLQLNDDCAVTISYDKVQTDANGDVIKDGNGNPTYVLTEYRKILFSGKGTANDDNNSVYDTEIGLPSNDSWKFKVTQWSYKYDGVVFSPGDQKRQVNASETDPDAIYGISKEGIKWYNGSDSDRLITIKHILQKDGINIGDFNTRVVNKMIPGGSSSN